MVGLRSGSEWNKTFDVIMQNLYNCPRNREGVKDMLVDIGKGFLSKLVDSTYDSARRLAKDKLEKDRITDTVTSHFEKMSI